MGSVSSRAELRCRLHGRSWECPNPAAGSGKMECPGERGVTLGILRCCTDVSRTAADACDGQHRGSANASEQHRAQRDLTSASAILLKRVRIAFSQAVQVLALLPAGAVDASPDHALSADLLAALGSGVPLGGQVDRATDPLGECARASVC